MSWRPPMRLLQDGLVGKADLGDKPALVADGVTWTYADLGDASLRLARALQNAGLERGERVMIFMSNTAECAVSIFGTLLAGGIFVIANPQMKAEKLEYVLGDSDAAVLLTETNLAREWRAAIASASLRAVFCCGVPADDDPLVLDFASVLGEAPPAPRDAGTIPLDLAALIYTSGSTGRPKGVMMTHASMVFAAESIAEYLRLSEDDRILNVLPLAFDYGLYQLLITIRVGATLVLERSFAFPAQTLRRIDEEDVTVFPGVPTIFATLLGMKGTSPQPSVRCITNTAAALPTSFHDGLKTLFPNALIFRMYGLTECKRVSYLEPELLEAKPTSVGKAIPGTEAFVLDTRGSPVKPGETGTLHVRGPHVMAGYWRAPEATEHMLKEGPLPGERVLCTHDEFTVDDEGFLYFVGRTDDVIKTRGEKVSPTEIEDVLHAVPGVRQAAVVGVPDELLGQAIHAYVVLDDGVVVTPADILRLAASKLENYLVPREIVVLDELPQTESGKVRKRTLLESAVAASRAET